MASKSGPAAALNAISKLQLAKEERRMAFQDKLQEIIYGSYAKGLINQKFGLNERPVYDLEGGKLISIGNVPKNAIVRSKNSKSGGLSTADAAALYLQGGKGILSDPVLGPLVNKSLGLQDIPKTLPGSTPAQTDGVMNRLFRGAGQFATNMFVPVLLKNRFQLPSQVSPQVQTEEPKIISKGGQNWVVVGYDEDGEPLVEPAD